MEGLIDIERVKRRQSKSNGNEDNGKKKPRLNNFSYNILCKSERIKVCLEAFLSTFSISMKRVRRIRDLKAAGKQIQDKRGRHLSFSLDPDIKAKIHEHVHSFPVKTSHYSGKEIKFLPANLNVKMMHSLFTKKHLDTKVSYTSYWNHFKDHFDLRFGQPQVDCCCQCEELKIKIKSPHLGEAAKRAAVAELAIHIRRSKKFYTALKQEELDAKENKNTNILAISMDFMMNLSLPKVPVQELFYLRQLTINIFCIHNIKRNTATIYIYHEGQAKKGPDETCSFLKDYFSSVPPEYDEVHIFSDNCSGQNKNHALSKFLLSLTDTERFKKVEQFFPVRGHSFLPCDRDFAIIKRALKRHDRIYSIHELTEIIINSSTSNKFTVVEVDSSELIYDFKNWWPRFYRKSPVSIETSQKPRDQRKFFGISSLFHLRYNSENSGVCLASEFINSTVMHTFILRQTTRDAVTTETLSKAYSSGKVAITKLKIQDIQKAITYVPAEHKNFYNEILMWPTQNITGNDEGEHENV